MTYIFLRIGDRVEEGESLTQLDIQIPEEGCMTNIKKTSISFQSWNCIMKSHGDNHGTQHEHCLKPFTDAHPPELGKKELTTFFWKAAVNVSSFNLFTLLRAPLLQLKRISDVPLTHTIARWW